MGRMSRMLPYLKVFVVLALISFAQPGVQAQYNSRPLSRELIRDVFCKVSDGFITPSELLNGLQLLGIRKDSMFVHKMIEEVENRKREDIDDQLTFDEFCEILEYIEDRRKTKQEIELFKTKAVRAVWIQLVQRLTQELFINGQRPEFLQRASREEILENRKELAIYDLNVEAGAISRESVKLQTLKTEYQAFLMLFMNVFSMTLTVFTSFNEKMTLPGMRDMPRDWKIVLAIAAFALGVCFHLFVFYRLFTLMKRRFTHSVLQVTDGQLSGIYVTSMILNIIITSMQEENVAILMRDENTIKPNKKHLASSWMTVVMADLTLVFLLMYTMRYFHEDSDFKILIGIAYINIFVIQFFGFVYFMFREHFDDCDNGCIESYQDAMYLSVVLHTTMGFGDIAVPDKIARMCVMAHGLTVFLMFGTGILAYVTTSNEVLYGALCLDTTGDPKKPKVGDTLVLTMRTEYPTRLVSPIMKCEDINFEIFRSDAIELTCQNFDMGSTSGQENTNKFEFCTTHQAIHVIKQGESFVGSRNINCEVPYFVDEIGTRGQALSLGVIDHECSNLGRSLKSDAESEDSDDERERSTLHSKFFRKDTKTHGDDEVDAANEEGVEPRTRVATLSSD